MGVTFVGIWTVFACFSPVRSLFMGFHFFQFSGVRRAFVSVLYPCSEHGKGLFYGCHICNIFGRKVPGIPGLLIGRHPTDYQRPALVWALHFGVFPRFVPASCLFNMRSIRSIFRCSSVAMLRIRPFLLVSNLSNSRRFLAASMVEISVGCPWVALGNVAAIVRVPSVFNRDARPVCHGFVTASILARIRATSVPVARKGAILGPSRALCVAGG